MKEKKQEIFDFIKKINKPFNPFHSESLSSKYSEDELKGILNRLHENGCISQNFYPNGGFSVIRNSIVD